MRAEEAIFRPIFEDMFKETKKNDNTEQYLIALMVAILLVDADTQKSFEIQMKVKDLITSRYELAYAAFCYVKIFGDYGDTVEKVLHELKRL